MFYVGQKVVCVAEPEPSMMILTGDIFPRLNCIYTIRSIEQASEKCNLEGLAFKLVEIVNKPRLCAEGGTEECNFHQLHFRPLVENKTDISELKPLLNPINHKQLEDA
jgi:hypothetical protein